MKLTGFFSEFVVGGIINRNKIFKADEFKLNGVNTDCYRGIFLFDESLKDYVEQTKSVKGFVGKHLSDSLVFDFDGEDLNEVKKEVTRFCLRLLHNYDCPLNYLRIAFSGSKGFHITLPFEIINEKPEPSDDFWQIYKNIALEVADGFRFIDSSIYEIRRLFRLTNTINSKSGLYKIPLSLEEFENLSIDEIKVLAKNPHKVEYLSSSEMTEVPALKELYLKWSNHNFNFQPTIKEKVEETKRDEVLNLLRNGCGEGNRHAALTKLVALFVKQGFDQEYTLEMLKLWNLKNSPQLPTDRLEKEGKLAFEYSKRNNNSTINRIDIFSLRDAVNEYQKYVSVMDSVKVKTGFPLIDKKLRGLIPGETLCILGKTSVGKSAFLQNIGMNHAKLSKEPVLFFSLEMPITSVVERTFQIDTGLSGYELENMFRDGNSELKVKAKIVFDEYGSFYTITKSGLSLEQIKHFIAFAENNIYQKKTGLILIDYLGLVKEKGNDLYEQVSRVARGMKDVAKEMNVPIIYLSQVTKKYSEFDELEMGAARDSGSVDEASDFVLALWKDRDLRSEFEQTDFSLNLGILKNRKGGLGKIPLRMQKRNLQITEV
jgi:replicative DNA helicase